MDATAKTGRRLRSHSHRAALFLVPLLLSATGAAAAEIELGFLNRTFTDLDSGLEPIREGPLTIHFSAPEHRLIVHSNRLAFRPLAGGRLEATLEVDLEGEGHLIARVEGGGIERRFTDDVQAPRQTVTAGAEIRLESVDGGFVFTFERATSPAVTFEIRSGVAGQIVGVCRAVALLPLFDLGCDRLERALSILRVPMPEPGTRFFLPHDSLSKKERRFFEKQAGRS